MEAINNAFIDGMIKMLNLQEWIIKSDNNYILKVPNDMANPSLDNTEEIILTPTKLVKAHRLIANTKRYEVNGKEYKEGDAEFDINKWVESLIKQLK